jgi:hypothetical protein
MSAMVDAVAQEFEAHRVELVQRAELAVRVPPFLGHGGELGGLGVVDGAALRLVCSCCHGLVSVTRVSTCAALRGLRRRFRKSMDTPAFRSNRRGRNSRLPCMPLMRRRDRKALCLR